MDCFASLAMTANTPSRSRGSICPRLAIEFPYAPVRGRRECRVHAAPAVSCAKVCKKAHTSIQVQRRHPTFPAQWFYGLYRALPGGTGLVVTVVSGIASTNLTPASGRQDHTTSPYASVTIVRRNISVHRIPSRACDDRETPLVSGRDQIDILLIWVCRQVNFGKSEILSAAVRSHLAKAGSTRLAQQSLIPVLPRD
jgi:hypothetical protein